MLIELRHHGGGSVKTDPIDLQVFHDALDVIARFSKWNAFYPIDRIHVGIARVAILLRPLLDATAARIVAGEGHDVRTLILLQQCAEFGRAHLRVVDRIVDHPFPIVGDAEPLGGVAAGFWRDLHQADRVCRRLVALVERTFGACHRIDDAVVDFWTDGAVLRYADRRKGVKVHRQATGKRRFPDLQHGARIVAPTGKLAERDQRWDVDTAFGELRDKVQNDVTLAERIEYVGGTHEFVRKGRTVSRIGAQWGPQLDSLKPELGARELSVVGGGMTGGSFIVRAYLLTV